MQMTLYYMAKEEAMLQGMFERLAEIGRWYGIEMKWKKRSGEALKAVVPNTSKSSRLMCSISTFCVAW